MKKQIIAEGNRTTFPSRLARPLASVLIVLGIGWSASAQIAPPETLVEGNTAFAFDLYARLSAEPGNVFFSPYSISTCLGMTYAGARGDTEKQMSRVLHFSRNATGWRVYRETALKFISRHGRDIGHTGHG